MRGAGGAPIDEPVHLPYFPDARTALWLDRVDAWLCAEILRTNSAAPAALEIGVFRGAWSVTMAMNVPAATVLGIDPYVDTPLLQQAKRDAEQLITALGLVGRVRIVPTWDAAARSPGCPDRFDLIHIDGMHTEEAVEDDLRRATDVLTARGVIAVDDYCRPQFPGVSSAVYRLLEPLGLRAFLATPNKIFLARHDAHTHWFVHMETVVTRAGLQRWAPLGQTPNGSLTGMTSAPTVLGGEVIVCLGEPPTETPHVGVAQRLVRNWVPPALRRLVWNLRGRGT